VNLRSGEEVFRKRAEWTFREHDVRETQLSSGQSSSG
jgi:hypothetical protein